MGFVSERQMDPIRPAVWCYCIYLELPMLYSWRKTAHQQKEKGLLYQRFAPAPSLPRPVTSFECNRATSRRFWLTPLGLRRAKSGM